MIVLKIGGDIFKKGLNLKLGSDIKKTLEKEKIVIVHGGGDEVTSIAEKLGKKQVFITSPGGRRSRYTDEETVEIYTMVMAGKINKTIVKWLLSQGVPAVGLSGIDAVLLRASRKKRLVIIDERDRKRIIDGGFTGNITKVDTRILELLVNGGYVPVISPIALGEENEFLNVDSDRAAGHIAGALKAYKAIFLTDVQGVRLGNEYVKKIVLRDVEGLLQKIGPGMDKKVIASAEAVEAGVKEAIIASGFVDEPVTAALNHTDCTVITVE
jgi:acetylglutamate/LysW-gamma-L-alpha-aminoadipate kinase